MILIAFCVSSHILLRPPGSCKLCTSFIFLSYMTILFPQTPHAFCSAVCLPVGNTKRLESQMLYRNSGGEIISSAFVRVE